MASPGRPLDAYHLAGAHGEVAPQSAFPAAQTRGSSTLDRRSPALFASTGSACRRPRIAVSWGGGTGHVTVTQEGEKGRVAVSRAGENGRLAIAREGEDAHANGGNGQATVSDVRDCR